MIVVIDTNVWISALQFAKENLIKCAATLFCCHFRRESAFHPYKQRLNQSFPKRRGTPTLALEKAMSEDIISTCDDIDAEIVRVLTEKFSWDYVRATSALRVILARSIGVKIQDTVKVCRDPNDDMFLECAALAKADVLIAGDKDLLVLGSYQGTGIMTPSEYLKAE